MTGLFGRELRTRPPGIEIIELLFQAVGLPAPIARLSRLLPRELPPFALPKPGRRTPDEESYGECAEQKQKKRRLHREICLGSAERIENQERGLPIDDGERDQHNAQWNDDNGEENLAPHGRGLPSGLAQTVRIQALA